MCSVCLSRPADLRRPHVCGCRLAYWGWGMSVTIGIGLVFFYNGWHTENVRIAKAEKDMQRRFDETVDFRALKNLPEWCVSG